MTGWPVDRRLHVLIGAERHDTIDMALRYLGIGERRSTVVPSR